MRKTFMACLGVVVLGSGCGPPMLRPRPYLDALHDLRVARACLIAYQEPSPGFGDVQAAGHEIDRAIQAIRREAVDDGQADPAALAPGAGRLREAHAALRRAEEACRREPDNNRFGTSLQARTQAHVRQAMRDVERAILGADG